MAIHVFKKTAITLTIYVILIFGILFLQFTDGSGFFLSIGGLRISGSEKTDGQNGGKTPELPIFISAKGINFFVDNQTPLTAVTTEGESIAAAPVSYIKSEDSFSIDFEHGISLSFFPTEVNSPKDDSGGAIISARIPEDVSEIRLGYKLAAGVRFDTVSDSVVLRAEKDLYSFSGTSFDVRTDGSLPPEVSTISIRADHPTVVYKQYTPTQEVKLADIAADPAASEEAYTASLRDFSARIQTLYQAAATAGTLSDPLVAAYVAENGKNGNYQQAVNAIPRSFLDSANRSYLTSVYINNLERNWARRATSAAEERDAYAENFSARNPSVFERKSLVGFLIEHRRTGNFPALVALAEETAGAGAMTARQAAGILELNLDKDLLPASMPDISETTISLCEEKIRACLSYSRAGARPSDSTQPQAALYLSEDGQSADTRRTLETAGILYRHGADAAKSGWRAAARLLASTILNLAADTNTVPEILPLPGLSLENAQAGAATPAGTLSAGDMYPLLEPAQSWYPHMVSIHPRYSVWTCARGVTITSPTENTIEIRARFPVGSSHYMIVTGIPQFSRIQIYEMNFRSDPQFETYNSSGYRYHRDTETLFLKMRHRNEYETVRLFLAPEQEEAPAPQAQPQTQNTESAEAPQTPAHTEAAVSQPQQQVQLPSQGQPPATMPLSGNSPAAAN